MNKTNTKYSENITVNSGCDKHIKNKTFDRLLKYTGYKFSINKNTSNNKQYESLIIYDKNGKFIGKALHYIYFYNSVMEMFSGEEYKEDNKVVYRACCEKSFMPTPDDSNFKESVDIYEAFCDAAEEIISEYETK